MVSNLLPLIFRSRPLGITARKPSLERGQVPHVGTSFACGRNSPQCKLVGAPSDACGHLLFMLGVHSLPPMERVASVRAPATVKRSSVSCTKEKKSSAKIGSGPRSTAESSASAAGAAGPGAWQLSYQNVVKRSFLVGLQGLQESSNARSEPSEGERGGYAGMAWHGAGMKPPGGSASTVAGQSAR